MFRRYENPQKLQEQLAALERRYAECDFDSEESIDLIIAIADLKERINFAWQDDEYESNYMLENYPEVYYE